MRPSKVLVTRILMGLLVLWSAASCCKKHLRQSATTNSSNLVDLVYPQLDTDNSRWFLFSSASRPFGMVNLSPDTQIGGAWGSGYRYQTDTVKGFSHIHGSQISGLSVMPVTVSRANKDAVFTDFYSEFSHETERISPGYHLVVLKKYGITAELTSTKRVGLHKYTFPANKKPGMNTIPRWEAALNIILKKDLFRTPFRKENSEDIRTGPV